MFSLCPTAPGVPARPQVGPNGFSQLRLAGAAPCQVGLSCLVLPFPHSGSPQEPLWGGTGNLAQAEPSLSVRPC